MNASLEAPRSSLLRKGALLVLLAALGGAFGFGFATLTDGFVTRWEDDLAVFMAAAMIGIGVVSASIVASARRGIA
jgi:hypothetical protein